jgi:hypothetical protein
MGAGLTKASFLAKFWAFLPPNEWRQMNTIQVPDLSGNLLVSSARERLKLTHSCGVVARWAFARDERKKRFEFLTWTPSRLLVPSEGVREHFEKAGFRGSTAAFIAFVMHFQPVGFFASIPEDDRFLDGPTDRLLAPCSYLDWDRREIGVYRTDLCGDLSAGPNLGPRLWSYTAFREVKT